MIKIKELEETCSGCPSQWEGKTDDDKDIYIRYRWGGLSIDINSEEIFSEQIGDGLDGFLTLDELKEHTKHLLLFPSEVKNAS